MNRGTSRYIGSLLITWALSCPSKVIRSDKGMAGTLSQ